MLIKKNVKEHVDISCLIINLYNNIFMNIQTKCINLIFFYNWKYINIKTSVVYLKFALDEIQLLKPKYKIHILR